MTARAATAALCAAVVLQGSASELVELDVVAIDRRDAAVRDLTQEDFQITDGGKPVAVQTFGRIAARGRGADDERSVVLLMDDVGVPNSGTTPMRQIARLLLSPARPADEIAVVRLSRARDEPFGDFDTALERIAQYHGGAIPFSRRDTPDAVLRAVARTASGLEPVEHRRKVVVCLGLQSVCDVQPPVSGSTDDFRKEWVVALAAAARANAALYMVDPTGLTQRSGAGGTGLVRLSGGEVIANSNEFGAAAERLWRDASDYYLLGYWGLAASNALRSVEVKTKRRDVRIRARQLR